MIGRDDNHKILSEEDRRAIDALLEAGLVDGCDRAANGDESPENMRQEAALSLLRKLEAYPVSEPDSLLVDLTMARIAREERVKQDRMEIHTPSWGKRGQWVWAGQSHNECVPPRLSTIAPTIFAQLGQALSPTRLISAAIFQQRQV